MAISLLKGITDKTFFLNYVSNKGSVNNISERALMVILIPQQYLKTVSALDE